MKNVDAIILCGGKGLRLREVIKDVPKPMAQVAGRPFLDVLIDRLCLSGVKRIILSVGYKKEKIIDYFNSLGKRNDCHMLFSQEDELLGTGGAVKRALSLVRGKTFLTLNGDSLANVDFKEMLKFHKSKCSACTVAVSKAGENKSESGSISLSDDLRIIEFQEKKDQSLAKYVNAGVYIIDKTICEFMPQKKQFSIEYDFFPKITSQECFGYSLKDLFIDIGTPKRLADARDLLGK